MTPNIDLLTQNGKATSNGIELYYEVFGDLTKPAVVLIMGLDAQCIMWSEAFIIPIVEAGFCVIRFDNRDVGLSTWITNWKKSQPYTLEDMALDTVGLLDFLGIKKAHFIGASMGGMITQRLAISQQKRVLSVTIIMSSAHPLDSELFRSPFRKIFLKLAPTILKYLPVKNKWTNHKTTVEAYLALYKFLAGTKYEFDRAYFARMFTYGILERKGQNPKARLQQFCAVVASGSRLNELPQIEVPALIIHGNADKLVPFNHSKKMATFIKNAEYCEMDGIGHEIPRAALPEYHSLIIKHLSKKNN
jgi:pimeloyl-ACP methyl ester carboxylesterase